MSVTSAVALCVVQAEQPVHGEQAIVERGSDEDDRIPPVDENNNVLLRAVVEQSKAVMEKELAFPLAGETVNVKELSP